MYRCHNKTEIRWKNAVFILFIKKSKPLLQGESFKGSVVKITLKHGLKPGIFLKKRFGRFLWFFRSVIYNPSRKMSRLDFSCKSLYLIVFVHLKKPCHILDIYRTPRNSLCIILISPWTWWAYLKTLDWIFWNNGHSAFNHALSKVSPKIEWN